MHYFQTAFIQTSSIREALSRALKTHPEVLNKSLIVSLTYWKPFKPITADCLEQDLRSDDSEEFKRTQRCLSAPARACRLARTLTVRRFGWDPIALSRRFVGLKCRGNLSFLSFSRCERKKFMSGKERKTGQRGWLRGRETFQQQVRYD